MTQGPSDSGNQHDRPDQRPTEPGGGAAPPPPPPPSSGQPGGSQQPSGYGPGAREPQPSAQQYGYGYQPGYGYPPGPQTEGLATAALVIAIVGFSSAPGGRDRCPGPGQQRQAAHRGLRRTPVRPGAGQGGPDHRHHRAGPDRHRPAGRGDRHGDRAQRNDQRARRGGATPDATVNERWDRPAGGSRG
jgi:hypothetical protein